MEIDRNRRTFQAAKDVRVQVKFRKMVVKQGSFCREATNAFMQL